MIKRLIDKLLRKPAVKTQASPIPLGKRVDVPATEHGIDAGLLDERAVKVVRTLQDAGFDAFIVGGAVRDLLAGRRPKDFDVATNATPEQVKDLFRRAFIIGRRFRIVHVVFGRGRDHEVVEVSTFRAYMVADEGEAVSGIVLQRDGAIGLRTGTLAICRKKITACRHIFQIQVVPPNFAVCICPFNLDRIWIIIIYDLCTDNRAR